jgi:hypothetical protein
MTTANVKLATRYIYYWSYLQLYTFTRRWQERGGHRVPTVTYLQKLRNLGQQRTVKLRYLPIGRYI